MTAPDPGDHRPTLYTLRGSGGTLAQAALLGNPLGNYDVMVGQQVDQNRWRVVEIPYLGGIADIYNELSIGDGVTRLVDAINNTPGKFAITGMSQGAAVASEVYKRIVGGDLSHRSGDFLGGMMFGNPFREAGHTIPGGTDPGGHGIAGSSHRLSGSETRWWDFSDPEDVFSTVGDDDFGDAQTATHEFLFLNWTGEESLGAFLATMPEWATWTPEVQERAYASAEALLNMFVGITTLVGFFDPTINHFGHLRYHLPYTGLPGNTTLSAVDLAVNQLNSVAPAGATQPPPERPRDTIAGLFTGGISAATKRGEFTPEIKAQLLERRWAYMNRKVKQPLIRLWDKEFNFIARLANVDTWSWEELATDDGEATVAFSGKANEWLREIVTYQTRVDEDLHVTIDPDPEKPTDFWNRWGGKVLIVEDDEQTGKAAVTTLHCISNRRHLRGILLGANPLFPMEVQIPKMFLWGGPTAFTCAASTFINLFRLQSLNGFFPVPRNIFAPETYLNNLSPLNWPIQVMPIMPVFDQSRWCTIGARWKDAQTILTPVMKDAGVICRAYTWLPGDPAPYEAFGPLKEVLKPTRACIILSFEDKSGYSGPTGTAADGALNLFAATLDDMITETLFPLDEDRDLETDPFFRKLLLVAPKPPPWVFRDVGYGNVVRKTLMIHKQQGTDIVTGGKSPAWVNMAITFAIRYGLSQLAQVISAGPLGAYEQYGAEGLDNLYQGQLDDVFLAFIRFVNPRRSANAGSYAFREYFEQGSGSAYTLNSVQTLAEGDYKMRAYASMKFDVSEGPLVYGEDYGLGDRVQAEIRGIRYVDQILAVKGEGARDKGGAPVVSFGDDTREEDPVARAFRTIGNVANFGAMVASGGDMF